LGILVLLSSFLTIWRCQNGINFVRIHQYAAIKTAGGTRFAERPPNRCQAADNPGEGDRHRPPEKSDRFTRQTAEFNRAAAPERQGRVMVSHGEPCWSRRRVPATRRRPCLPEGWTSGCRCPSRLPVPAGGFLRRLAIHRCPQRDAVDLGFHVYPSFSKACFSGSPCFGLTIRM
jgi:hypothetical protein